MYIPRADMLKVFEESLNKAVRRHRGLVGFLRNVEEVSIYGLTLRLKTSSREPLLYRILESLNQYAKERRTRIVIAFDEAQEMVKLRGLRLLPIIAYAYDKLRNITVILTGSQVGLLYRFLGVDNPGSPLYGRMATEIRLSNLERGDARRFLIEGFKQYGVEAPGELIEEALDVLDGNIGWLTYFGAHSVRYGATRDVLRRTVIEASKLALRELDNFLMIRPRATARRYILILLAAAEGANTWSRIKRFVELEEGARISDSILYNLIGNLLDAGFLERLDRTYRIPDPILKIALREKGRMLARRYR